MLLIIIATIILALGTSDITVNIRATSSKKYIIDINGIITGDVLAT